MSDLPAGEGPEGLPVIAYRIGSYWYCPLCYPLQEEEGSPITPDHLMDCYGYACDQCHVVIREALANEEPVFAYTIPYSTYRLMMCLRCAKTYPDGPDKKPVTQLPPLNINRCDKCHVRIQG